MMRLVVAIAGCLLKKTLLGILNNVRVRKAISNIEIWLLLPEYRDILQEHYSIDERELITLHRVEQ